MFQAIVIDDEKWVVKSLIATIKNQEFFAANAESLRTLFIIISSYAEFAYAQKAMLHNAVGYCLKPFSRSELIDSMQKAYNILQEQTSILSAPELPPRIPTYASI